MDLTSKPFCGGFVMYLKTDTLDVSIGNEPILYGVNFTAKAGEITSIVGPNGSGKTTLLKAITGELTYTGQVTLNSIDISEIPTIDLSIQRGVLPQTTNLAFPFTVIEVVRIGLVSGQMGVRNTLPHQVLEKVGLGG
jgi:iron complex transport system ATP-binding protein